MRGATEHLVRWPYGFRRKTRGPVIKEKILLDVWVRL